MDCLRTPDDRFTDLPDFRFAPNYLEVDDCAGGHLRMHYLDEGRADAAPILVMHGEPTWCYLYRHMIPQFVEGGHRVLAPDLIGFGRSDKPVNRADYTYRRHVDWMTDWLAQLDLKRITLFCHDWGGLIGLRLVAHVPERFERLVLANTALPTGDPPMSAAFRSWRDYSQDVAVFNAGRIVHGGTVSKLTDAEIIAYNAPFPDSRYQAGARQFPMLVPDRPEDPDSDANRKAWQVLEALDIPVLTIFGADDKVMAGFDRVFQVRMPGARGQNHRILRDAGHFLQEDMSEELARATLDFCREWLVV
jgi:haloalkane dehalogenase